MMQKYNMKKLILLFICLLILCSCSAFHEKRSLRDPWVDLIFGYPPHKHSDPKEQLCEDLYGLWVDYSEKYDGCIDSDWNYAKNKCNGEWIPRKVFGLTIGGWCVREISGGMFDLGTNSGGYIAPETEFSTVGPSLVDVSQAGSIDSKGVRKDMDRTVQGSYQSEETQKLTSTSETTVITEQPLQPQEEQKLASIPKDVSITKVSLRRKPVKISSEMKITYMLAEYDFFDRTRNPHGSFISVLVDNNDGTATDRATGLMWQMSGSSSSLDNRSAKEYIKQLNRQRFAGYSDWRMPTIEELASLIKRTRRNGVYIDPVFDGKQTICWSADTSDGVNQLYSGAWIVDFGQGQILKADYLKTAGISHTGSQGPLRKNDKNFLKAVRSTK